MQKESLKAMEIHKQIANIWGTFLPICQKISHEYVLNSKTESIWFDGRKPILNNKTSMKLG